MVMVVFYVHSLDRVKVYRYIGFAHQAYRELAHAQPVRRTVGSKEQEHSTRVRVRVEGRGSGL